MLLIKQKCLFFNHMNAINMQIFSNKLGAYIGDINYLVIDLIKLYLDFK